MGDTVRVEIVDLERRGYVDANNPGVHGIVSADVLLKRNDVQKLLGWLPINTGIAAKDIERIYFEEPHDVVSILHETTCYGCHPFNEKLKEMIPKEAFVFKTDDEMEAERKKDSLYGVFDPEGRLKAIFKNETPAQIFADHSNRLCEDSNLLVKRVYEGEYIENAKEI